MRVAVIGAGVGGLACAVRLAEAGHRVTVFEQATVPGGKAGRATRAMSVGHFTWDSGPSLLTMPWVVRELLGDGVELLQVEPVTRYRWADGSTVDVSSDHARTRAALEAWSPGAGADWLRFLGVCAAMWRAGAPVLEGAPPWPPRRPAAGERPPDPRDLGRVRPWHTLRTLAEAIVRDPRLRMVVERFATYAGADPRRAPAALALAGFVEHAHGAWHPRGGIYAIVEALVARLQRAGGELRLADPVERILRAGGRATGVVAMTGGHLADVVVANADELAVRRDLLGERVRRVPERSVSGLAIMAGLRGRSPALVHHEIRFPAAYDAEFDDLFVDRRPVRDPTIYVSTSCATVAQEAPPDAENPFVLVNAPAGAGPGVDWEAEAERVVARLGWGGRELVRVLRTPDDLEAQTGAVGGAIYGAAPHGRLGTLRRPGNEIRGTRRLYLVGGTVHPGGGLPIVMLGARRVAALIGPA